VDGDRQRGRRGTAKAAMCARPLLSVARCANAPLLVAATRHFLFLIAHRIRISLTSRILDGMLRAAVLWEPRSPLSFLYSAYLKQLLDGLKCTTTSRCDSPCETQHTRVRDATAAAAFAPPHHAHCTPDLAAANHHVERPAPAPPQT